MKFILKTGVMISALIMSAIISGCATAPSETVDRHVFADNLPLAPVAPAPVVMPVPVIVTPEPIMPPPVITAPSPEPAAPVMTAEMPIIKDTPAPQAPIAVPASKPALTVRLSGLKTLKGVVSAALFDEAGYKAKDGVPNAAQNIPVTSEALSFTFDDVAAGEYGLKLYHDVNENGKLDTNFIGIPTEPYAFSNSALNPFGEAKWKNAKFTVGSDGAVQKILFK